MVSVSRFFLAGLYDIQVDLLQLYLALQDDPHAVEFRQSRLREKIERYGKDLNSVQARIHRWIEAYEAATDESRQQSIVFYREPDGERALRAYRTRDVRLEQAGT